MAEREQKKRAPDQRVGAEQEDMPAGSESTDQLKSDMDDLLDEIDEVLETNAEDLSLIHI